MHRGINKVTLLGIVGQDPLINKSKNGDSVANLNLVTLNIYKDKQGERQESFEWHQVVFFGKLAEIVEQQLKKGARILVEGRLQTNKYMKDGIVIHVTKIICCELFILDYESKKEKKDSSKTIEELQDDEYKNFNY